MTEADSAARSEQTVSQLIEELPEIYQPIYGHPQLQASRSTHNHRLDVLVHLVGELSAHLDRPLRIVDLGSAQGYLTFTLAELGHHVVGIDSLGKNVAVARAIQAEHPQLDVQFIEGDITECGSLVSLDDYDLVLGFSVLHHVAHRNGHASAVQLVTELATHVPHAVFEMALASEPLYWADALPTDPRATLAPYAFIRELGRVETHLSEVQRPVLFASRSHVFVNDGFQPIESWREQPHAANTEHLGLRRYFFVPSGIVKVVAQFRDTPESGALQLLRDELRREAHILEAVAETPIQVPELKEFVDGTDETIIFHSVYPGVLLSEVVGSLGDEERAVVTGQVLDALAELEVHGLYHTDIRLWNVVWDHSNHRARLIDYGAVSTAPSDIVWPNDAYFSLLVWLVSLWSRRADQTGLRIPRSAQIDSAELPPSVSSLIASLLVHRRDDHVCRDIAALWSDLRSKDSTATWPVVPVAWGWLAEIEQQHNAVQSTLDSEREAYVAEIERRAEQRDALISERDALGRSRDALVAERETLLSERDALKGDRDGLEGECAQLQRQLDATEAELQRTLKTWSWRVTWPIRRARSALARSVRHTGHDERRA